MYRVKCRRCKEILIMPDEWVGRPLACQHCGQAILVKRSTPQATGQPSPPPPERLKDETQVQPAGPPPTNVQPIDPAAFDEEAMILGPEDYAPQGYYQPQDGYVSQGNDQPQAYAPPPDPYAALGDPTPPTNRIRRRPRRAQKSSSTGWVVFILLLVAAAAGGIGYWYSRDIESPLAVTPQQRQAELVARRDPDQWTDPLVTNDPWDGLMTMRWGQSISTAGPAEPITSVDLFGELNWYRLKNPPKRFHKATVRTVLVACLGQRICEIRLITASPYDAQALARWIEKTYGPPGQRQDGLGVRWAGKTSALYPVVLEFGGGHSDLNAQTLRAAIQEIR